MRLLLLCVYVNICFAFNVQPAQSSTNVWIAHMFDMLLERGPMLLLDVCNVQFTQYKVTYGSVFVFIFLLIGFPHGGFYGIARAHIFILFFCHLL